MAWFKKHPEVVYTDLEDGAVLLHLETKFYYSLNEVGQAIWRMIDSVESSDEMTQKLLEEYEVEADRATKSISRFIKELQREKLVVAHQGGTK